MQFIGLTDSRIEIRTHIGLWEQSKDEFENFEFLSIKRKNIDDHFLYNTSKADR
jgi:hypothetical protein